MVIVAPLHKLPPDPGCSNWRPSSPWTPYSGSRSWIMTSSPRTTSSGRPSLTLRTATSVDIEPPVASNRTTNCKCCHLVPSSRVRPVATSSPTTAVTLLHLSRSLPSHLMQLMEGPVMLFTLSSHLVLGLPCLLVPLISRASHHSTFPVPVSPHVQRILKLIVPPSIPVSSLA